MNATITKVVMNYTKKNYFGDEVNWGTKPGRLMSVTYCLSDGTFAVKNTAWPEQHSMRFVGRKSGEGIDWESKKTAKKETRFISKY